MSDVFENPESERAVIGAILNDVLNLDALDLSEDDFCDIDARQIFGQMVKNRGQNLPTDMVSMLDALPLFTAQIVDISTHTPIFAASVADGYIANVKNASLRRSLSKTAQNIANLAQHPDVEPMKALETARTQLDDLVRGIPTTDIIPMDQVVRRMNDWLFDPNPVNDAIPTGLVPLDAILGGGIRGSKLCVIGARPSVGKSALGLQIAHNAASCGKRVLLVSLEMDEDEIYTRMLARYTLTDVSLIEQRRLTEQNKADVRAAHAEFANMRLFFSIRAQTPAQIKSYALRTRMEDGLDLIVVDYIQLLQSGRKTSNRVEEVGQISRDLKLLAMELKIPVVAMTQMNRNSEGASSRMPRISESRESGSIEQDANQYIILHAPDRDEVAELQEQRSSGPSLLTVYDNCKTKGYTFMTINVAKNRNGRKGSMYVAFDAAHMRFLPFDMNRP